MSKNSKSKFEGIGLTRKEKNEGQKLFKEYQNRYHVENFSDLNILEELVYREILHLRTKNKIGDLAESDNIKDQELIPKSYWTALDDNLERILRLKETLGFFQDKKTEDALEWFKVLIKKFKVWREENQGTREVVCPFCSKLFYLMIRTDKYDAKKWPMFKDKIICNETLWALYKSGEKVTKQNFAKILGVGEDYIDWLSEKIYKKNSK